MSQTTITTCDKCGLTIEAEEVPTQISYFSPGEGSVTLHFHDACFDRREALQVQIIQDARERQGLAAVPVLPSTAPPAIVPPTGEADGPLEPPSGEAAA